MKTRFVFLLAFVLVNFFIEPAHGVYKWELVYQPRQRVVKNIKTYKDLIFIGTGNGVKISSDGGSSWKDFGTNQLNKDSNGNSLINWIEINNDRIFIATDFGAYSSEITRPKWVKVFENNKTETSESYYLFPSNEGLYICSNDGFWRCKYPEVICERFNEGLSPKQENGNFEALYFFETENNFLLGTSNGIYKSNKDKIFWTDITNNILKTPENILDVKHISIDQKDNIWIATKNGIYRTSDLDSWEEIDSGIEKNNDGYKEVFYILNTNEDIYCGTASGVYKLENQTWVKLASGIRTKENNKNIYSLAKIKDKIFACTDEGLFKISDLEPSNKIILKGEVEETFAKLEELEPSAIEVQKQALKFSSLPTNKDFTRYSLQARLRNLVPRVSFDLNSTNTDSNYLQLQKGIATDVALNNEFDSDKTTQLQRDGRNYKQLSILWDTNQILYDNEIKDLISQARLTANIKENLLDDVTRLYYQRKKAIYEDLNNNSEKEKIIRSLEIAELTSQIDSRTGGWFSREIERRKKRFKEI